MSQPATIDLSSLIRLLVGEQVEFIVVGGAASILHGAMLATNDLDIVPRRTSENLARLKAVLDRIDAIVREPGSRRLKPGIEILQESRQLLLRTTLGPLDLLFQLHDGRGYDELLPRTDAFRDGVVTMRAVDLPTLIEIKIAAGRPKDQIAVPHLLAILREREGRGDS